MKGSILKSLRNKDLSSSRLCLNRATYMSVWLLGVRNKRVVDAVNSQFLVQNVCKLSLAKISLYNIVAASPVIVKSKKTLKTQKSTFVSLFTYILYAHTIPKVTMKREGTDMRLFAYKSISKRSKF